MDVPTVDNPPPPDAAPPNAPPDAPPGTTTLRAGIIGLGVGERHIAGYLRHPAATVVALCDRDPLKRAEVSRRHPELRIVETASEILDDPAIDIVSIASYDDDHAGQVLAAIANGKHVFVEKPLCTSPEDARGIRDALAGRPGVRLSSNLILRRSPRFRELRAMVRDGHFGRLFHLEGSYHYGRLDKLTHGWRGRSRDYSVTLGGAVHLIDQMQWISERRVEQVAAFGSGLATTDTPFLGHDLSTAILRFEGGVTGTVTANFACARPHGHALRVYGTDATFENGEDVGLLFTSRDPGREPQRMTTAHPGAAKGELLAAFIDEILGRGVPEVPLDDVFGALAVCFAIDRSRCNGGTLTPVEHIDA